MKKATIKIRRKYHDIELKRLMYGGETIEVSLERAKTLCSKGLADVIEVNHYKEISLDNLTVKELKEIAKEKDIKTTGLKKQELIDKILET